MATLQERLAELIPAWRDDARSFVAEHGARVISEVTIAQAFGGMRGVKGLICDTSVVEPGQGLIIRGYPLAEVTERLPEEIFYLLCTGELPDAAAVEALQQELVARGQVPAHVWDVLQAMPADSHPMAMLTTAILVMEKDSRFRQQYDEGLPKTDYWKPTLEDALNLLARLPGIAAGIYRMRFEKGPRIDPDPELDWGAGYARMLGLEDPAGELTRLIRLYLTLHCDHEGGNVSAFTCHTVGSALSDAYYAVSAGLNGLAGPLHGLANQECLAWVLQVHERFDGVPTDEQLTEFAWETLKSGKVIPGYGHAVLRVTDPRFDAFLAFGRQYCLSDPIFQIVAKTFEIVPGVLREHGKARNPWPNVDAGSGALLYHYGLRELPYYTVLFAVSRAMGLLAQLTINRGLGTAITRPKSVSTRWCKDQAARED